MSEDAPDKSLEEGQVSEAENSAPETPQQETEGQATADVKAEGSDDVKDEIGDNVKDDVKRGREEKFDPNNLPEKLKPVYKAIQADATKKYQAIAEKGKYADLGEKLAKYSNKSPEALTEEMEKLATQRQEEEASIPKTPEESQEQSEKLSKLEKRVERHEEERAIEKDKQALKVFIEKNPEAEKFSKQLLRLGMRDSREYEEIYNDYIEPAVNAGKASASEGINKAEKGSLQSTEGSDKDSGRTDHSKMSVEELEKILPHAESDAGYLNN